MMRKLRTLVGGFLLASCLTLSAQAFTGGDELAELQAPQQSTGWCWVYFMGRYWQVPC